MVTNEKTRSELRQEFAESTSCHGIIHIQNNKRWWKRTFWTVLVLAVFGILISQVVDRINAYYTYSTTTKTSEEFVKSIQLPAITICNFNRYFNLNESHELQDVHILSEAIDFGTSPMTKFKYFNTVGGNFSLREYMITKGFHLTDDTMFLCAYSGTGTCNATYFKPILTNYMGLCWTLQLNASQLRRGFRHGVHIIWDVLQNEYTENPALGTVVAGIKFQVHSAYELPQVDSLGQTVGVGLWASTSIHKINVTNMYKPWGPCNLENEVLRSNSRYTLAACVNECHDRLIAEMCGCREPTVTAITNIPECTPQDVVNCTARARFNVGDSYGPEECGCTQPCNEVRYRTQISYSTYPNQVTAKALEANFNLTQNYLRENLVGLSVYYDALSVTNTVETEAITGSSLLSDIGGQLGLWIGMSIVTVFEFFQFFLRLFLTIFDSDRKKDAKTNQYVVNHRLPSNRCENLTAIG